VAVEFNDTSAAERRGSLLPALTKSDQMTKYGQPDGVAASRAQTVDVEHRYQSHETYVLR
jgi:hypothetical protein